MSDRTRIIVLLAPAVVVTAGLFYAALGLGLLRSFNYMPVIGLTEPNFAAYEAVLTSQTFLRSFALSLHIAVTSTLLSAVVALGAAMLLRQTFPGRTLITFLFQLNLTIPHIVGAIGILYLFSQSGVFARLSYATGMITRPAEFLALVFDPYAIGIILQYVWKEVPFIGLILLANLQAIGTDHESTARSLGATRWQAFRHVLLPMLMPGLLSASALVFAFAFGAYEIPLLLGANAPAALPVLAWRSYADVDLAARPEAMAMSVTVALLSAALIGVSWRLSRRNSANAT
jgi:putative spermidine/putrescine transport system permease protein